MLYEKIIINFSTMKIVKKITTVAIEKMQEYNLYV